MLYAVPDLLADLQSHFADTYVLERELGGGGMSRVFVARDERLDRRVVIKLLPPQVTATISAERFKREIMLAAQLQHPNIVPVLSAGELGTLPYFVMPFIDGESLRARMMRGPLSVRETVTILKDVVRALGFAHNRGIIHRDIKPDNVLLAAGAACRHRLWRRKGDFRIASAAGRAAGRPNHDGCGDLTRYARLHGTRAGSGRSLDRPPRRSLRPGNRCLRDAHRSAALPRTNTAGTARRPSFPRYQRPSPVGAMT
jgi:serine/threonine-protein kinase